MDDFAGHPLLRNEHSELNMLFTTTRHINMTVILCIQTWRFINFNFKRMCTDIVIWKGFCSSDFIKAMNQCDVNVDIDELHNKYKKLEQHQKLIIHGPAETVEIN
jgi:hypothetical protein